jgi:uncharacterized protein YjiS (DUF1127 family)
VHAYITRSIPAAFMSGLGGWLTRSAQRMDDWLAARAKARDDLLTLEAMSDRELRDIGIDPGRVHSAPRTRDWPI